MSIIIIKHNNENDINLKILSSPGILKWMKSIAVYLDDSAEFFQVS